MSKCKELVVGCGLAIITSLMWLVSSCSQPVNSSVPVETPPLDKTTSVKISTTKTQTTTVSNSTPASPTATTELPTVSNSAPAQSPTTTTEPSIVGNSTPAEDPTDIDITSYRLVLNGLVNTPLSLSYAQILAYPAGTQTAEIVCPDIEDETVEWTGVPVSTLLNAAGLTSEGSEVVFTGVDGYSVQLPLESVLQDGVFLAYMADGQTLPQWRGYPLRLVLSGSDGLEWVQWITNIEVKPALASFTNSSAIIQNSRAPISVSGRRLCSCIFLSIKGLPKSINQS